MANKHQVLSIFTKNPELTSAQIALRLGCMPEYVRATLSRHRAAENSGYKPKAHKPRLSSWSAEDLARLVASRESGKRWADVATELNRPLPSCFDRYSRIVRERGPVATPVPSLPKFKATPLHQELGIETYVHMQAIACDPRGRPFMPVTLAKVFA
jgi:hypothetical protein